MQMRACCTGMPKLFSLIDVLTFVYIQRIQMVIKAIQSGQVLYHNALAGGNTAFRQHNFSVCTRMNGGISFSGAPVAEIITLSE